MATLESFDSVLKEVVTAKRLSASKMNKLTEIALNLMENDTQLVSILYRTHKTLAPSSKIHSLYAFDALSRAARSKVNKLGLTGDINAEKGNCATFLLKIDGVLDALIQDMMSIGPSEAKEKTRKILDIWTKNNTFPSSVLTRLAEVAKDPQQKDTIATSSAPSADPRPAAHASPPLVHIAPPQPLVATDPAQTQALIQALLGSAVPPGGDTNISNGSTDSQIGTNLAGIQANQVVLLQQLVERAKAGNGNGAALPLQGMASVPALTPTSIPVSQPPLPQVHSSGPPLPSASHSSPPRGSYGSGPREEYYGNSRREQGHSRWHEQQGPHSPRNPENEEWQERDRPGWRGGYRGGSRGGHSGRGGGRQSWRDHEDWDTRPRHRQSRSRSPPRYSSGRGGGSRSGRDVRPYSPPRRPSLITTRDNPEATSRPIASGAVQSGKDEFGRDIRPASPNTPTASKTVTVPPAPSAIQPSSDSHHPSGFTPSHVPSHGVQASPASGGLDQVDFTTFDFSSATAWEALGKAWEVTHGSMPSQEQLMELVVGRIAQAGAGDSMHQGRVTDSHADNGWTGARHPQPGKSIPTYESGSNLKTNSWQGKRTEWQSEHEGYDNEHGTARMSSDTDAVVLGGGGETQGTDGHSGIAEESGDSSTGGMKRVGDGWVWRPS